MPKVFLSTYIDPTFSISSGILTSLDGAVLLVRTQNVTKMRKFCVALTKTNAVLTDIQTSFTIKNYFSHARN